MMTFSHRNGESEPPTIEGEFWFDGAGFVEGHVFKWRDRFEVEGWNGRMRTCCDRENGAYIGLANMVGKWYGPIVPPWGEVAP